ncbi:BQ2448_1590 [Microbotryum intermedium]|uniref:BQ2448_1590 protein n=1 Tax=Microbotryum intermedium TaxID=269621 RepID=A0A238FGM2_9BASI|nr:BQ2448_1590 [Microbotryum intermedium]
MPESTSHAAAAEKASQNAGQPSSHSHHGEEKKAGDKPEHEVGAKSGKPITTQADLTKPVEEE